jgi:hypothetical protein
MTGVSAPWRRPGLAVTAALLLIGLVIGASAVALLQQNDGPAQAVTFDRLSSRRGTVTNGRFIGSDGKAIYSASWEGGPLRLYPATPGSRISSPLEIEDADLLSVSVDGKRALALNRRYPVGWEAIGTLAIATPGGAAPRQILEDVLVADWGPDGESLAVAHEVDGVVRLEYPIGTVLYQSPGWISDIRVHPDGDRILIADCPGRGDNTAAVRIVDTDGKVETVAPQGGSWGVLWAPDGETVLSSTGPGLFRVRPGGTPERIYGSSSVLRLLDIDADGRLLVSPALIRREQIVKGPDSQTEADLSWLDWSTPSVLSQDGRRVLFEEGNEFGPGGYGLYMRDTDGSPPLHLGYGSALALSPSGDQVAVIERQFRDDAGLVLLPTGLGKPVNIELGGLRVLRSGAAWLEGSGNDDPDTLILSGRIDDGVPRIYRLPLSGGGPAEPITPQDLPLAPQGHIVSLDGLRLIVNPADGPVVEFSMDGSGTRPVPGIEADDLPLSFHRDGRHIFVQAARAAPAPIFMIDTVSGERTMWQELSPRDRAGVSAVDRVLFSTDGDAYAYSIRRMISGLSILDGLQP